MKVITRRRWGAKRRDGFGSRRMQCRTVHVHHSVTKSYGPKATLKQDIAAARTLENIGNGRFGGGISYNWVITESGRVFVGVSADRIGAHTKGHNTTGVGIVLVGNYDKKRPSKKQLDALEWLIAHEMQKGHIAKGAKIYGHRDTSATACPGDAAYALLPGLRKTVAKLRVMPTLRRGSSGGAVVTLKRKLAALGYGGFNPDSGAFGPSTQAAVKAYQKKAGLPADGVVDADVWAALL